MQHVWQQKSSAHLPRYVCSHSHTQNDRSTRLATKKNFVVSRERFRSFSFLFHFLIRRSNCSCEKKSCVSFWLSRVRALTYTKCRRTRICQQMYLKSLVGTQDIIVLPRGCFHPISVFIILLKEGTIVHVRRTVGLSVSALRTACSHVVIWEDLVQDNMPPDVPRCSASQILTKEYLISPSIDISICCQHVFVF